MGFRCGWFLASAAVSLIGIAPMVSKALAQSPAAASSEREPWWFHGNVEIGGRVFLNNPPRNGVNSSGQGSLAKYYEYSTVQPGPFSNAHVAAGSKDGLYQVEVWAKNIGYSDQAYVAELSKAGQQYLSAGWDQTPHLYSTSGQTLYNGVGSAALTLPAGLSNKMFIDAGCTPGPAGCVSPITAANAAKVRADINSNIRTTDIGIRRDTASFQYRWTPTTEWDVKAEFSDMRRTGTQVEGVVFSPGTSGVRVDAPKPVADNTKDFGLSGEYAGAWLGGNKFNLKLAYNGSRFENDLSSYTVENPFCPTGAVNATCARSGSVSAPLARMSLDPSNQANTFAGTLGADLPWKSRYMGTLSYSMMRQNEAFLPFTITPFTTTGGHPTGWVGSAAPVNSIAALPAASLNGAINTLLINNVVTTQITSDLKSKLSYRYYNFDNNTPVLGFADWVLTDAVSAKATTAAYAPVNTLSMSYTKQNADSQLNWHPVRSLNLGALYDYELYDRNVQDVDTTKESTGKVFADWKPVSWIVARGSASYSERRYENYNYLGFVGAAQWPVAGNSRYSTAYRQFYLDNRDRNKGQLSIEVVVARGLTVTPTAGWRHDDYNLNPNAEVGLNSDHTRNAGVEVAYMANPDTHFLFSYMYEHQNQVITSAGQAVPPFAATAYYTANVEDRVNTFIASVDHTFVPDKLNVRLGYTLTYATSSQPLIFANGTGPTAATGGQYPDVRTRFQRFDVLTTYKFDQSYVRMMGWRGDVKLRLRYAYERNSVDNWQIDSVQSYIFSSAFTTAGYMTWLAQDNPNYNVHLVAASISWAW
jgi:hypothetical protein